MLALLTGLESKKNTGEKLRHFDRCCTHLIQLAKENEPILLVNDVIRAKPDFYKYAFELGCEDCQFYYYEDVWGNEMEDPKPQLNNAVVFLRGLNPRGDQDRLFIISPKMKDGNG